MLKKIGVLLFIIAFTTSCNIFDKYLITQMIDKKNSSIVYQEDKIGKSLFRKKNKVLFSLGYDNTDNMCYPVIGSSKYELKEVKFTAKEIKNAKVLTDSVCKFEDDDIVSFDYLRTIFFISSQARQKSIFIHVKNNTYVSSVSEKTSKYTNGNVKFLVWDFDESGTLIDSYEEHLW